MCKLSDGRPKKIDDNELKFQVKRDVRKSDHKIKSLLTQMNFTAPKKSLI